MSLCALFEVERKDRERDRPTRFDSQAEVQQLAILHRYLALTRYVRNRRKERYLERLARMTERV